QKVKAISECFVVLITGTDCKSALSDSARIGFLLAFWWLDTGRILPTNIDTKIILFLYKNVQSKRLTRLAFKPSVIASPFFNASNFFFA
ncbi:MAG: hypothetical protein RBT46_03440, partial [Weeksellaceae bacterium]|nr:hypothetical protein [Weeksellaceae bacterium]